MYRFESICGANKISDTLETYGYNPDRNLGESHSNYYNRRINNEKELLRILNSEKDSKLRYILSSKPHHICKTCKGVTHKSPLEAHRNIMSLLFPELTEDIYSKIWSFLVYPQGHLIHFTLKSRSCPDHMTQNNEDDRDGYYWEEAHHICTKCFKSSLYYFISNVKRLPELRNEAYVFSRSIPSKKVNWVWANKLILPDIYYVLYNHTPPVQKDHLILIPSK